MYSRVNYRRFFQWLLIIFLLFLGTGGYFWYQSQASNTTSSSSIANSSITSGLVGQWTFDQADIDWSTQYSIRDHVGTNHGDPFGSIAAGYLRSGRFGQALNFDGAGDYVQLTNSADVTGTKAISLWFKPTNGNDRVLFYSSDGTGNDFCIIERSSSFIEVITEDAFTASRNRRSTVTTNSGTWYHIVVNKTTFHPESIYLNGVGLLVQDDGNYYGGGDNLTQIGGSTTVGNYSNAIFDDIRIYNRNLSASEVYQIYTAGNAEINAPPEDPLSQSLRGYWKMDEGTGTSTTADSSGNGNTLSMTGPPTWTTGNIGPSALDFSGSGQYLSIASPTSALDFADGASFTITGWFNRDTFANDHTILSTKSGQSTESDGYIAYIDDATDALVIRFDENGSTDARTFTSTSTFTATGWHHFALSWNDSAPDAILYIDGNPDGSGGGTAFASMGNLANANAFYIGAETDAGNPFDGKLDDIRIYGYALSADQVKKIYNTTSPTQPIDTSLVGHWTFDGLDIQGTAAIDRSSFGNNGTITGTTKTIGKLGQALSFNGSSDVISMGASYNGVKTVAFWTKPASTTQSILDLNATATVDISSGVVRGNNFSTPTVYVDGVATIAFPADTNWHQVTVTTETGINASALYIGKIASSYLNGSLDDVRIYSRALLSSEVLNLYTVSR